ncbi:MAG: Ppx/GppA family phosphatase [Sphingomonadales bacterium]|nr:Ppx/GppA family phosphatase [Sphingomonadales bacterium]NCQ22097.1 Ppx/GppA family phosphatase [Sphingomonadales bacterium]NCT03202.1 Ppx/GppA family phosphatase [Sphingomonadales bacterium]
MIWGRRRKSRDKALGGGTAERAIIDIGSNTVRLVVYGGTMRAPTVLHNEKVTAKLGREIASTGRLADEAMALALRGLKRFILLLADLGIKDVATVATAAVRDAENGPEFVEALLAAGLNPRVISGEEEALLSAHGVIGAFPDARGIVADLGGGSLELVRVANGQTDSASTLPLGTLRLPEHRPSNRKGEAGRAEMRKNLDKVIQGCGWDLSASPASVNGTLYLVGGTWRAMAVFAMASRGYPLSDPHGFVIEAGAAMELAGLLAESEADVLKDRERISSMRAEKLPDAAVLLQALLTRLAPERVVFSSWGLREGLLYDRLPAHTKTQDPLLAGVAVFTSQRGSAPTLATRMAAWTLDAAPAREHGDERLRLAATMLALAAMQIEPNIRLPHAINWALHKRWVGIDGKGRAMLAAAIAANGNQLNQPADLRALAGDAALEEAVRWGLALRLARRLGGQSARSLEVSRLVVDEGMLVLRIAESHADLIGLPTEKDMKLLAGRLGIGWRIDAVPDSAL